MKDGTVAEGWSMTASRNQRRYVAGELTSPASYMIALGHRVEGTVDIDAAMRAFRQVLERHEALRTVFEIEGGDVRARVLDSPAYRFEKTHLNGTFEEFRNWAVPLVFEDVDVRQPGSMVRLLIAIGADHWRFTVAMHHAITDGFSRGKVNEEFLKILAGEPLEEVESYYDFDTPPTSSKDAARIVDGFPDPARMPADGCPAGDQGDNLGHFVEIEMSVRGADLKALAGAAGSSKFGILTALYGLGLSAFTGDTALSTFFQTDGRQVSGAPLTVVGPFSNTLPLDLSFDPATGFSAYAQSLRSAFREAIANESAPLMERLLEIGRAPWVSINKFPSARPIVAGDLAIGPREFLDRRTEYDLNLVWTEEGDRIVARAFYDAEHLSRGRALAFLELQDRLLQVAMEMPEASCAALLDQAREGMRVEIAQADTSYLGPEHLHDRFLELAGSDPQAVAVITTSGSMTYADLAIQARKVAAGLDAANVDPDVPVAIFASRSPEMIAAMLGVSIFGGSFAVIDATLPDDRIGDMLALLGTRHVIPAGEVWPDRLPDVVIVRPARDGQGLPDSRPVRSFAYHLFTSGTTGQPKLVSHPDRTLLRFVAWQADQLALDQVPVTLMLAGLSHDPIMRDIFLPLSTGGTIAMPSSTQLHDPVALNALARTAKVSVLHVTPATARLVSLHDNASGFAGCRAIFWGGDRVAPSDVAQWRDRAPDARQWNLYGATETPQAALIAALPMGCEVAGPVPIGLPMPWTGLRLEASDGQAVGPGELGEIVIRLAEPVAGAASGNADAGLVHRTGDLGIWLPDTGVLFAGRRDAQVKINGHRIEPAEVARLAERVPDVRAAECLLIDQGRPRLHLFVAGDPEAEPQIHAMLARHLPDYMQPEQLHFLERMPLTANGKTDRAALVQLVPDTPEIESDVDSRPVRSEAERIVARIYQNASGLDVKDAGATLASLGTDSLSTIEARIDLARHGITLPDGWEWMTISELAERWTGAPSAPRRPWSMVELDSFVLLRTVAIILIVFIHWGNNEAIGGGSTLLVALAGFTFGTLQLPAILNDGLTGRVWALIAKILIPLVPVSLAVYGVHAFVLHEDVNPSALFFYENFALFISHWQTGGPPQSEQIIWLWFLHAYLQMFAVIAILLGFGAVRRRIAADPWRAALAGFVLAEIVAVTAVLGIFAMFDDFGTSEALAARWPTTLFPLLLLGILFSVSRTPRQLMLAAGVAAVHAVVVRYSLGGDHYFWLAALPLVVLVPRIPAPALVASIALLVSANALMIYLTHKPLRFALTTAFGEIDKTVYVAMALAFGVICGLALRPVLARLGVNRLAQARINFS